MRPNSSFRLWLGTLAVMIVVTMIQQTTTSKADVAADSANGSSDDIAELRPPFDMPKLRRPQFADQTFDIRDYGAKGNGQTKATQAIRRAIEACTTAGGGKVLVPNGQWPTGAIHLKSNVNLHLAEGAELHFSDTPADYLPVVFTRWAGFELYNYSPLIYAYRCENIAITGPGKIFGHGKKWWPWEKKERKNSEHIYYDMVLKNVPPEKRRFGSPEIGLRPQLISPTECKNVLLEGFTIAQPGPFWTIQLIYCENVIARRLRVETVGGPNTDGLNLDSCKNALVEHCYFNTGDDCVALKSGINEDGRRVGRPTENVVVRHIRAQRGHGGIVIGSDTSGGVRNVFAHDCFFNGTDKGIRMKSNASRGGVMENLLFQDIRMKNIRSEALVINTNYGAWMASKEGNYYPLFRNITYRRITCNGVRVATKMEGTSHQSVENITMENVSIRAKTGMHFKWVNGLELKNVDVKASRGKPINLQHCQDVIQQ